MKIDRYAKVMLTLIVTLLGWICVRDSLAPRTALAQTSNQPASGPTVTDVRLVDIALKGSQSMPVKNAYVYTGYEPLAVKVIGPVQTTRQP